MATGVGSDFVTVRVDVDTELSVLEMGIKFTYRVPSFSVLCTDLRQIKYQLTPLITSDLLMTCDGFIRADQLLETKSTPFAIILKDYCFVPVEEFNKDTYVEHLQPLGECGLLVVWQWEEKVDEEDDVEQSSEPDVLDQRGNLSTDSDVEEEQPTLTTCTFKCIGVTRSASYQETLKEVNKSIKDGNAVPVKVVPEPTNPYDSHAISFQCQLQQKWHTIGYVVREVCDSIHDALSSNSIVSVQFAWVKYKVVRNTGPGYYAAINITRKGTWPPVVTRSANTMY